MNSHFFTAPFFCCAWEMLDVRSLKSGVSKSQNLKVLQSHSPLQYHQRTHGDGHAEDGHGHA